MKLSGTFLDINDTPIEVVIENKSIATSDIVIGCAGDNTNVFFADDPLSVDEDYDSTFDVMVQKSGQLTLLTKGDTNLVGILFANNQHNVTITINKDGDCVFYGFVEPNVYSQDYAEEYTQLDINFTDFLSTLQYGKLSDASTYNEAKQAASTLSFKDYIEAMGFFDIGNVYFDKSSKVSDTGKDTLSGIGVSGSLFFGDTEDDEWTFEDILKEILQYLNLHIIQIGKDFYIFDWSTLTQSRETNEDDNMDFLCLNDGSVEPLYFPKKSYRITEPDYASNDTQISVDEVYNQIQVKCDLKNLETIVESPLDSEKLVSLYPKRFLYCTEYAVKKKNNKPILAINVDDFNNIIHNQSVDNDNAHKYDWYMRPLLNNSWKFYLNKSVSNDTIESIYPKVLVDGKGSVYGNPWMVSDYLKQNALTPCMFNMAYIDTLGKNISDNEVKNDFDDNSNYLYISINGNGDDTESGHKPSDNDIKAHSGMIEYQPSNSAVILSPTDDTSTNYLVFSGKISLQPLTQDSIGKGTTGDFMNYGTLMKDAGGRAKSCYAVGFKGGNGDKHGEEEINEWYQYTRKWYNNNGYFYNNSLSPYVQERSPWKYKYNYTSSGDRTDKYMKLPILECEMTVGDKRLIETNIDQYGKSTFKWVKIGEEPIGIDNEPITTFSLGVNPKIGDCIIGTEFDLQNTIDPFMNIDGSGTAIPIKASDKLSGKITFKILGPINLTWNNVTRRHPSFWRHTKWTEDTVFVLAHTENIVLKDFECKIKTSSDIIMNKTDNDLIYMSDETKKYIKKNDSTEMKINTLLTTQEAYELGVSNSVNLSTAIDMSTSMPLKTISKKSIGKPEQLYVDAYWNEYNKQRMLIDVTFKSTKFGDAFEWRFRPIKFNYFDGGFYPISTKINYKNDQTTMKLKEGASLSEEFMTKYDMDVYFLNPVVELDVAKGPFYQKLYGAPRKARMIWSVSNSDVASIDDEGNITALADGETDINVYVEAKYYNSKSASYKLQIKNVPSKEYFKNNDVISWTCYSEWQESKNIDNKKVSDEDKKYIVVTNKEGDIYKKQATYFLGNNKFATTMSEGELLLDIDPENYTYLNLREGPHWIIYLSSYTPNEYKAFKLKDVKITNHNHIYSSATYIKNKDNPSTYNFSYSWYKLTSLDVSNCELNSGGYGYTASILNIFFPSESGLYSFGLFCRSIWKEDIDNCSLNTSYCTSGPNMFQLPPEFNTFNGAPSDFDYSWLSLNPDITMDNETRYDAFLESTFANTSKEEYDLTQTNIQKQFNDVDKMNHIDGVTLEHTIEACDKARYITLFDKTGNDTLSFKLRDTVFTGCTNLQAIFNIEQYEIEPKYGRYLFSGCKNLMINDFYIEKFMVPNLKYYHENNIDDKLLMTGFAAFTECNFEYINYTVDLSRFNTDSENRHLNGPVFFENSNIKKFIYDNVPTTVFSYHDLHMVEMFENTPIEYCDLTGAGFLRLPGNGGEVSDIRRAFYNCNKLKTLIIDGIICEQTSHPDYGYNLNVFNGCTSLKTIILHYGDSIEMIALRLLLSESGLNPDDIDIRFKS